MRTLLVFVALALVVLSLGENKSLASGVVVPAADCSVTVVGGKGEPCDPSKCEEDCRKEHDGMGACAAIGCSCAVCVQYPPSSSLPSGGGSDRSQKL